MIYKDVKELNKDMSIKQAFKNKKLMAQTPVPEQEAEKKNKKLSEFFIL